MRGAPSCSTTPNMWLWIIPADAGSTSCLAYDRASIGDHPRGCGEHKSSTKASSAAWGSSPRMRGAPINKMENAQDLRIIPADAGSTGQLPQEYSKHWDHPRGCGEHKLTTIRCPGLIGSSPRMRGARYHAMPGRGHVGIIPADAGSTDRC